MILSDVFFKCSFIPVLSKVNITVHLKCEIHAAAAEMEIFRPINYIERDQSVKKQQ